MTLLNTTLGVIARHGADIIDTGYLIPYGLVCYLASQITGIPFILRHGGSDLTKFVDTGIWSNILSKAFTSAAAIISDTDNCEKFNEYSERVVAVTPYVPDPESFRPQSATLPKPTLALIGKANYYWRHKGWHKAVEIMKALGNRFHYLILSQGTGFQDFRKYVEERLDFPIEWRSFVHPFEMSALLQSITRLFILQHDLPFPVFQTLYRRLSTVMSL